AWPRCKGQPVFPGKETGQPFQGFLSRPGKTSPRHKGLLTAIDVPYPAAGSRGVYLKHAVRGAMDIAMVGVAVLMTPDATKNAVQDVRIGLGAVAPTPIRAARTEALLRGKPLTPTLVKQAAEMAASESSRTADQRSPADYRRWIGEALTRRGLAQTWKAATGKEVAS